MSDDTDVRTSRRPVVAFALWLTTALVMTAWFFYALLLWVLSANGGTQLLVAGVGVATAVVAGEVRNFWPDAMWTRRVLVAAVVVLFVVWLVVAGSP